MLQTCVVALQTCVAALQTCHLTPNHQVLDDARIKAIAARLGVTAEQVVFRWAEDVGMMPLTGTSSDVHRQQDLAAAKKLMV